MKRLNRVPLFLGIGIAVVFLAVLVYGLSSRGLRFGHDLPNEAGSNSPASSFAEQMKRGVKDGIIGDQEEQPVFQPTPTRAGRSSTNLLKPKLKRNLATPDGHAWNRMRNGTPAVLREQREQIAREQQRQRMASLQAKGAAIDSPLKVDISDIAAKGGHADSTTERTQGTTGPSGASDLYAAALRGGIAGQAGDPNGQASKEDFFNADIKELGYLPNQVVLQQSRYELKRGSVIPATLITGINSTYLAGSLPR